MLVLGDGVTSSFETWKWALNLGSLQGQYMILTAESSFQPYILNVEYYPLLPPKLFVFVFETRSYCSPDCPGTPYVGQ